MNLTFLFGVFLTVSLSLAQPPVNHPTWTLDSSRITAEFFGVEPVSMLNIAQLEQDISVVNDLVGIGLVGINGFAWGLIELQPPINSVHSYRWPDKQFKLLHDAGIKLQINVISLSPWGTVDSQRQSPPKPAYWNDFRAFLYNLVERYDGDGVNDALGITYPLIAIINIGSEIEMKGAAAGHWFGTAEQYNQVQQALFEEAKRANSSIVVARGASNFADVGDDSQTAEVITQRLSTIPGLLSLFDSTTINAAPYYDLFGFHFNHYYTGIFSQTQWLKQRMASYGFMKRFYSEDTRSARVNSPNGILPPFYSDTNLNLVEDILEILDDTTHLQYEQAKEQYYRDQAILLVKKLACGLSAGLHSMIVSSITDWLTYGDPNPTPNDMTWRHAGLIDTRDGTRKPAFYSYQLFVQKVLGAKRAVEQLNLGQDIYAFRFQRDSGDVFVLWYENAQAPDSATKVISLSPYISSTTVKLTSLITAIGDTVPKVQLASIDNVVISYSPILVESAAVTSVEDEGENVPKEFVLYQNYPNPFNPTTTIRFSLTASLSQWERVSEGRVRVTLRVFDVLGREVATLVNGELNPGEHSVIFDAKGLASGVYFYRLTAGTFIQQRKMEVLK